MVIDNIGNVAAHDGGSPTDGPVDHATEPVLVYTIAPVQGAAFIVNEMLSYVGFYRHKSNADALRRVVLNFYTLSDITDAKKIFVRYRRHDIGEMQFDCSCSPRSGSR